jgi:hypothetical protein
VAEGIDGDVAVLFAGRVTGGIIHFKLTARNQFGGAAQGERQAAVSHIVQANRLICSKPTSAYRASNWQVLTIAAIQTMVAAGASNAEPPQRSSAVYVSHAYW